MVKVERAKHPNAVRPNDQRPYWVTYRGRPRTMHTIEGPCVPDDDDNVSFGRGYDVITGQGFQPCVVCEPTPADAVQAG